MNDPSTPELTFESFFHEHSDRLLRAIFLLSGDRQEAEDLAQESFVRVFERWDRVRSMDSPEGYLFKVGANLYRKRQRQWRVRERNSSVAIERTSHEPDESPHLTIALHQLRRSDRELLILSAWIGLSDTEIGSLWGLRPNTVRVRLHRARGELRRLLEASDDERT